MALPGALVWTSRFLFATLRSIQINLYIRTQRTSLDDIWCWFWKRLVLLHCIKTALNSAEVHSQRHEGGIISTFLVQTLSFFHFAQVSDQIWKYDIESIRIIQTHTYTFLTPCKLRFLLGGLTIFIPVFTFLQGRFPNSCHSFPKFFSSLLLGVCEEERSKWVGWLVLLKKGKVRCIFFYIILWKKSEIWIKGAWKLDLLNNVYNCT